VLAWGAIPALTVSAAVADSRVCLAGRLAVNPVEDSVVADCVEQSLRELIGVQESSTVASCAVHMDLFFLDRLAMDFFTAAVAAAGPADSFTLRHWRWSLAVSFRPLISFGMTRLQKDRGRGLFDRAPGDQDGKQAHPSVYENRPIVQVLAFFSKTALCFAPKHAEKHGSLRA